jgi:tellurite resistance protein TerC
MNLLAWVGFLLLIGFFLALDLGVFHKKDEVVSTKSALRWTAVWFVVAMLFNVAIYFGYESHLWGMGLAEGSEHSGKAAAQSFLAGYLVEQSLSLDNIFVIALVFKFFRVPPQFQHRVLFWGILGAIILRITMILAGAALIQNFKFTTYIFGGFLVFTAIKMATSKGDEQFDPEDSWIVKQTRKFITISPNFEGNKFFTVVDGKKIATPLFLVLLVVEASDIIFAVDSIPAIFGVTTDPFIVFTSNIFAIMGLRSLYFALSSMLREFAYLKHSLVVVLGFVGVKMLIAGPPINFHIPPLASLGVIVFSLAVGIVASLLRREEAIEEPASEVEPKETPGGEKI